MLCSPLLIHNGAVLQAFFQLFLIDTLCRTQRFFHYVKVIRSTLSNINNMLQ